MLSDEWIGTNDGVDGLTVLFFIAHHRAELLRVMLLRQLEKSEAEKRKISWIGFFVIDYR
jgi:hypothetical protein